MTTFVVNGSVPFDIGEKTFSSFDDFIQFIRPYFLEKDGYKTQLALQEAEESGRMYASAGALMDDVLAEIDHEV